MVRIGRVGRVVLNLPRAAYEAGGSLREFKERVRELAEMAIRASALRRRLLCDRARRGLGWLGFLR